MSRSIALTLIIGAALVALAWLTHRWGWTVDAGILSGTLPVEAAGVVRGAVALLARFVAWVCAPPLVLGALGWWAVEGLSRGSARPGTPSRPPAR